MSAWDRQINSDGDDMTDALVDAIWACVKQLKRIADALEAAEPDPPIEW